MPFEGFTFDDSVGRTEPGRPRVPEGYYLLRCDDANPTPEEYEKTPGIIFSFTIMEGAAGVGRQIPRQCVLKNADPSKNNGQGTQFALGQTLGALGQAAVAKALIGKQIANYSQFQALANGIAQRVKGQTCVALIADQPPVNGRQPFSGIEQLLPADEWPTMKNATLTAPNAPRAATPAAAAAAAAPVNPAGMDKALADMFAGV